jgi:Rad3-related DNA helicase
LQENERKYLESTLPQGAFLSSNDRVDATVFVPNTIASYNDTQSFYPSILKVIKELFKEKNSAVLMVTGQKVMEEVFALSKKFLGNDVEVMAIPINTKYAMAKELFDSQKKKKLLLTTVYMGFPEGIKTDALLMSRLPFEVMNTPWYNYRTRNLENSFLEYALPRAVIKFLRWIVACPPETEFWCFDKRIHTQKYAREFTKYLGGIDIQNI